MRVISNPAVKTEKIESVVKEATSEKGKDSMETTEKVVKKDLRKCTIDDELIDLFVTQIQSELSNHNLYASFASYYNAKGLYKLNSYWLARAKEEYEHHLWVVNYLNQCNAVYQYPEIPVTKLEITDDVTPFKATVDREIETTGMIYNILNKATEKGDWITVAFLFGNGMVEGKLIPEQSEEMKLSMDALSIAEMDTDWVTKQDSIYSLYFKD